MPNISFTNAKIEHLNELDQVLNETYDITLDVNKQQENNILSLAPNVIDRISYNPFKIQDRTYPVDMGFKSKLQYNIQLEIPEQYEVTDKPQNVSLALPESAARYKYITQLTGTKLEVMGSLSFNKPIFTVDEYFSLKELYSRIIQQQKLDIRLTTKK
ncbi:hypothetical protein D3C80_919570 [compost metagenome]